LAIYQIPVIQERNNYTYTIDLENTTYIFGFYYNTRAGYWTLNIYDATETLIIANIPLLLNVALLAKYNNASLPPGLLYMLNLNEDNAEATFENFGVDVLLMYDEAG